MVLPNAVRKLEWSLAGQEVANVIIAVSFSGPTGIFLHLHVGCSQDCSLWSISHSNTGSLFSSLGVMFFACRADQCPVSPIQLFPVLTPEHCSDLASRFPWGCFTALCVYGSSSKNPVRDAFFLDCLPSIRFSQTEGSINILSASQYRLVPPGTGLLLILDPPDFRSGSIASSCHI